MKTLLALITCFSFFFMAGTETLGETRIDERKLLSRDSIDRYEKKEMILKNRNINFKELSRIQVVFGHSLVECFFGYQNKNRLVLCYK